MNKEEFVIKISGITFTSLAIFYLTYSNIKANLIHLYYLSTLVFQVALTWELFLIFLKYLDKKNKLKNSIKKRLLSQIVGGTLVVLLSFTVIQLLIYPFDKFITSSHRLHGYWDYDIFICFLLAIIIELVYFIYYLVVRWKTNIKYLEKQNTAKTFISKVGNRKILLSENDVLCFFTENKAVYAFSRDRNKYILDLSLEKISEEISDTDFYRANRQFIIRKTSIKEVKSLANNRLSLETDFSSQIPVPIIVSRNNTPQFRKWFNA